MYRNFGDVNFLERGCLVDTEHSDTEFDMLVCRPYDDEEDKYQFAHIQVDIEAPWIERSDIMQFIGMTEETWDPVQFAIGCADYFSWEKFGAADFGVCYDWTQCDESLIRKELRKYLIAWDDLRVGDEGM